MKAIWNNSIIAESSNTVVVEGNHYFPPDALDMKFFESSDLHTVCSWKGEASYYHVNVDGNRNDNAAWYYPETLPKADKIKGYVAFWKGVQVVD